MLELASLTLREIQLRLKEPFRISSGVTQQRRVLLVEVQDRSGVIGWGECPAGEFPHYSSETVDTAWIALRDWIAPLALQRHASPSALATTLAQSIRGHPMARAGVEMAAWELTARREETSLASLLGGVQRTIPTGISIGIQDDPERLAQKALVALDEGYRRIKIKIKPGADEPFIAAVREAIGDRVPIMADANSAYSLRDAPLFKRLDAYHLMMIEQPLAWDDLLRHAELQRQLQTPLCLDESIVSADRAEDMVALASGRIINIKPARVGGFTEAVRIHDVAADHGMPVWCGGLLESGIGRAHNVALASLPNFRMPGDLSPSQRYWERDIVVPEWTMQDGLITVPMDGVGMGVTVDRDFIDDLTLKQETVTV